MPNLTDQQPAHALRAMLAFLVLGAALEVLVEGKGHPAVLVTRLIVDILAGNSAFVWFCRDSDARHYVRSWWRNVGFNVFGLVFLPWYLLRTHSRGQKFKALCKLLGLLLLMLLLATIIGRGIGLAAVALV